MYIRMLMIMILIAALTGCPTSTTTTNKTETAPDGKIVETVSTKTELDVSGTVRAYTGIFSERAKLVIKRDAPNTPTAERMQIATQLTEQESAWAIMAQAATQEAMRTPILFKVAWNPDGTFTIRMEAGQATEMPTQAAATTRPAIVTAVPVGPAP